MGAAAAWGASSSSSIASPSYWRFSRTSTATMTGTSTTITQAPCVNLVMPMMTATIRDKRAPVPFTNRPQCQPSSLWVMWCLAMPAWDKVKLVNTPMA